MAKKSTLNTVTEIQENIEVNQQQNSTQVKTTKKISKKTKKSSPKTMILTKKLFLDIQGLFNQAPRISSAKELTEKLTLLSSIPAKFSISRLKKLLTDSNLILYSRKNPQGYYLNSYTCDYILNDHLGDKFTLEEFNETLKNSIESEKKLEISKIESKPIVQEEKLSSPKMESNLKESPKISSAASNKKSQSSKDLSNAGSDTVEDIINRIPVFPRHLMSRISSNAQKSLKMGLLDINRLSITNLEKNIDYLTSARMFYDDSYQAEKEILQVINEKVIYMTKRLESMHESEGKTLIVKNIEEPMNKGKFDKIISKLGKEYNYEECAWQIVKKMGRKAKKIPLSEYVLRKEIVELLTTKYPEKP